MKSDKASHSFLSMGVGESAAPPSVTRLMTDGKSVLRERRRLNCAAPSGSESPFDTSANAGWGLEERRIDAVVRAVAAVARMDLRVDGPALSSVLVL